MGSKVKKIFQVRIDDDFGEVWVDENFNLIEYFKDDEGDINNNHVNLFKHLGYELISTSIRPTKKQIDKLIYSTGGDKKEIIKLLNKEIKKAISCSKV